jgi:probable phosphoglycerate mutase
MHVIVEFDGGSRGNPGPAAYGVVVRSADDGTPLKTCGRFIGNATNNVAEWRGLIFGLERARDLGASEVTVRGDSQLVIRQMTGEYRVKQPHLKPLHEQARRLAGSFRRVRFLHNTRDNNELADKLANLAMNRKGDVEEV